ncbi:uncharacterized protein B0H18DRAFT_834610, partial [Fomitopsis serialis]|uniref:uncharacterized protein n=1 Tax=Fomitopsis serialis TaxID=139415 RepID=UPI002007BE89
YDLILIQEPCLPNVNGLRLTRATPDWRVIYPSCHHDTTRRTRSVILVNRKVATDAWTSIPTDNPDVTAITLDTSKGKVHIFNVY